MSLLPGEDEHLTTGWEPEVDPADSLVRQAVYVHAAWAVKLAKCIDRPWADGPDWAAGHVRDAGVMSNWVVLKRPLLDHAAVIAEVDTFFPAGVPFLLVSAWPTPDLRAHRLALVGHPPLMWRPPLPLSEPASTDLSLGSVSSERALVDAERVLVDGYPLPELQPFQPLTVYTPALLDDSIRVVVAYDGDQPLATACGFAACGVTLVENVAVMPAARGRGAGAAVTWAATSAFPGQPAVLIASDDGQPVYARLGYQRLERWTIWLRPS
jgi:hypothetical protein